MRKKKSIRLLIIAFLLAAICACSAVSVYAIVSNSDAKSGDSMLLYEESFDSVTERVDLASGENPGVAGGWTFVKSSDNAKAYIDGGRLHLSGNKYDMVYLTDGNWTNYTLEADMYYKSATSSSGWVGMLYNLQSEKDFQKAGINPNKKYSLNGKVDGSWKNDVSGINKGFSLGDDVTFTEEMPFRIKVVAYNNNAILYYALLDENGAMKSDYVRLLTIDNIPEQTRSGSIGFMTSTNNLASVWVDNIKISNISEDDLLLLEPSVADIYEADTGIVNPPVAVEKITSSLPALDGERAAVVIAELDSELNVIGKDGSVLTTADDFIDTYRKQLIPAFLVDSEAEADALAALMHDKNLTDAYVVAEASNAALVKRVRVANSTTNLITGALIFGDLNSPEARSAARELVVDNMSYVAISTSALTEETAFYFASRQIAAWGFAESTAEVYRGIANGYHGIVSESVSEIYGVYESITEPTVSGRTVVIAHRGVNAGAETPYPENTLMAIRAAKEVYGADCVEIDFGLTKDGYVILMHDTTVDRTTNGTGNFSSFTLEEIKALTVDYVEGKETTVPTLEEALLLAKELDIVLYCHVKTVSDENIAAFSYLVDKHDCRENVLLFTSSLDKYNSAIDRVVTGTGYELVDSPVLIDGIQFTAGNQKLFSSYDNPLDGVIAMRKCLNKYNFQPIFYPYIEQGDMWGEETFYYQLSARGFVNTHSITNGQEYMDSTALTGSGAVGWLTNNPHLCDDYHYAIDLSGENLNLKIGESIDTAKTLKLICGTANVSAGIVQLSGPALNSVNTLAEEGTVTVVYYADRKTDGGTTYRTYSEPVDIKFGPEKVTTVTTPHGIITEEFADADEYPFVVFDGDGNLYGGYKSWIGENGGALSGAYYQVNGNVWDADAGKYTNNGAEAKTAIIYLRRDYEMSSADVKFQNFGSIKGEVTLDLGDHTLSQGTSNMYVLPLYSKGTSPTTLNVRNGRLLAANKRIIQVYSTSTGAGKRCEINFEGVTFGLRSGSTISALFYSSSKGSGNTSICDFYFNYNDCIFDLETVAPSSNFTVFPNADTSNYCKVVTVVNGGELRFGSSTKIKVTGTGFSNGSSLTFGKYDGKYSTLTFSGKTVTSEALSSAEGDLKFVKVSDGNYTLASLSNSYGFDIPQDYGYAEAYPFILFDQNGNFLKAYEKFLGSNGGSGGLMGNVAYTYLSKNIWDEENQEWTGEVTSCIALLRRDYTLGTSEYFNNWGHLQGSFTLDLSGYSISQQAGSKSNALFKLISKGWSSAPGGKVFPTTVTVKNGSINMYSTTVVSMECWDSLEDGSIANKYYTFNLENVKVGLSKGATLTNLLVTTDESDSTTGVAPFFINFNDCEFDLVTNSNGKTVKLFNNDASASKYVICDMRINGGVIKALSADLVELWALSDPTNSAITFGKSGDEYIRLILTSGESAPTTALPTANGNYKFVKTADDGEFVTYKLADNSLATFVPKVSLTLYSDFAYNIYVPVRDFIKLVKINGEAVTLTEDMITEVDGVPCYKITKTLAAKEAATDFTLTVTVELNDGRTASAKWTLGILKYLDKLLTDSSISKEERALAEDILVYIKTAYAYFNMEDAKEVGDRVDSILGKEGLVDANVTGEAVNTTEGLASATVVLGAEVAFKFTPADPTDADKFVFTQNGRALKSEIVTENGKTYILVTTYAYGITDTVSYTAHISDNVTYSGSFNLKAYYDYAVGQSMTDVAEMVRALWQYSESAEAYRASVAG